MSLYLIFSCYVISKALQISWYIAMKIRYNSLIHRVQTIFILFVHNRDLSAV